MLVRPQRDYIASNQESRGTLVVSRHSSLGLPGSLSGNSRVVPLTGFEPVTSRGNAPSALAFELQGLTLTTTYTSINQTIAMYIHTSMQCAEVLTGNSSTH